MGPDVLGVDGIIVEPQPVAGPVSDNGANSVVFDGVFPVFTPQCAVAVEFFAEASPGAPSTEYAVPTCEPNSGGRVFHDILEVVDASPGVDTWPPHEVPFGQVLPDPFLHVECGELP